MPLEPANGAKIVAKKKPTSPETPKVKRNTIGTSFRLSQRCHDAIDRVAEHYQLGKNGAVELGMLLAERTLEKATLKDMDRIADEIKKNPK